MRNPVLARIRHPRSISRANETRCVSLKRVKRPIVVALIVSITLAMLGVGVGAGLLIQHLMPSAPTTAYPEKAEPASDNRILDVVPSKSGSPQVPTPSRAKLEATKSAVKPSAKATPSDPKTKPSPTVVSRKSTPRPTPATETQKSSAPKKPTITPQPPKKTAKPVPPKNKRSKYDVGPPDPTEMLELVNEARRKAGLPPLSMHGKLQYSAQWKVDDMVRYKYFAHKKPGQSYANGLAKIHQQNIGCSQWGENLVMNSPARNTSRAAFETWMSSAPHRKAILTGKYNYTGFGVSGVKAVQHFCAK